MIVARAAFDDAEAQTLFKVLHGAAADAVGRDEHARAFAGRFGRRCHILRQLKLAEHRPGRVAPALRRLGSRGRGRAVILFVQVVEAAVEQTLLARFHLFGSARLGERGHLIAVVEQRCHLLYRRHQPHLRVAEIPAEREGAGQLAVDVDRRAAHARRQAARLVDVGTGSADEDQLAGTVLLGHHAQYLDRELLDRRAGKHRLAIALHARFDLRQGHHRLSRTERSRRSARRQRGRQQQRRTERAPHRAHLR